MIKYVALRLKDLTSSLFFIPVVLSTIGLIALGSIAKHQGVVSSFDRQLLFMIPAFLLMAVVIFIPKVLIHKFTYLAYVLILIGIALPFLGSPTAGTYRWINIGSFNFQPSEFAKWITVLALARYLSDHKLSVTRFSIVIIPISIIVLPMLIILKQPDLGTAVVMLTPLFPMLFWVGARPYHLFLLLAPVLSVLTAFHIISFVSWVLLMAAIIYLAKPNLLHGILVFFGNIFLGLLAPLIWNSLHAYQQKRILTLFNPELDPLGAAYQIIQSQTAIGSGGLFGKGWGQGTQTHLKFLPVQESDFILSVIGEEFGFIVIMIVLVLFGILVGRMIYKASRCPDRFSSLTIIGIASIFLAHVFVNTAMTVGLIPVKGLPLPFISYGGSFLVSCYIMIGLVINMVAARDD